MLAKTFNNAAFRGQENAYRQELSLMGSGKSPAYNKIEVIFGLFKLRSREMERLEGEIGHSRFRTFKADAQKELDRLTNAQVKLLLKTPNDIPALLSQAQNDAEKLTLEERANLRECATIYRDYAIRSNPETQNLYRALQRVKRQPDDSEADTFEARKPYRWSARMKDQPVADVLSLDVHEGMAALSERAMKDPKFFELLQLMLKKHFGEHEAFSADNLYKLSIWPKFEANSDWWTNGAMRPVNCVIMTMAEKKILDGEMVLDEVPAFHRQCWKEFMGEDFEPDDFDDEGYWYDYQGYTWTYQASEFLARPLADKVKADMEARPPQDLKEYLGRYIAEGRKTLFGTGSVYTAQQVYDRIAEGRDLVGDYMQSLKKEIASLAAVACPRQEIQAAPVARPA